MTATTALSVATRQNATGRSMMHQLCRSSSTLYYTDRVCVGQHTHTHTHAYTRLAIIIPRSRNRLPTPCRRRALAERRCLPAGSVITLPEDSHSANHEANTNGLVRYLAWYGHMASVLLGRNAVFSYEQVSLSVGGITYGQIDIGCSRSEILSTYRAASLFEFLMLRHGILAINADFTRSDIDDFIRTLLVQIVYCLCMCAIRCFFLPFLRCTLCTIYI